MGVTAGGKKGLSGLGGQLHLIVGDIKNVIIANLLNSYTIAGFHGCMELYPL
jgi:hypothetical protein